MRIVKKDRENINKWYDCDDMFSRPSLVYDELVIPKGIVFCPK